MKSQAMSKKAQKEYKEIKKAFEKLERKEAAYRAVFGPIPPLSSRNLQG